MQTLSIQIQDSYMQQFMNFVKESHSNITVAKDKNLEIDPYFYENYTPVSESSESPLLECDNHKIHFEFNDGVESTVSH